MVALALAHPPRTWETEAGVSETRVSYSESRTETLSEGTSAAVLTVGRPVCFQCSAVS